MAAVLKYTQCCFRETVAAGCSSPCRPAGCRRFATFRRPLIRSYRLRKSPGDSSGKSSSLSSSSVISALAKKTFWAIPLSSALRARAASASAMIPLPFRCRERHVTRRGSHHVKLERWRCILGNVGPFLYTSLTHSLI